MTVADEIKVFTAKLFQKKYINDNFITLPFHPVKVLCKDGERYYPPYYNSYTYKIADDYFPYGVSNVNYPDSHGKLYVTSPSMDGLLGDRINTMKLDGYYVAPAYSRSFIPVVEPKPSTNYNKYSVHELILGPFAYPAFSAKGLQLLIACGLKHSAEAELYLTNLFESYYYYNNNSVNNSTSMSNYVNDIRKSLSISDYGSMICKVVINNIWNRDVED